MRYLSTECIGTLPIKIAQGKNQIPLYYQRVLVSLSAERECMNPVNYNKQGTPYHYFQSVFRMDEVAPSLEMKAILFQVFVALSVLLLA